MKRIALLCHRRPWWVLGVWLLVLLGALGAAQAAGGDYRDSMNLPASDSTRAQDLLDTAKSSAQGRDQESIVVRVDRGRVTDPQVRRDVTAMLGKVAGLPQVTAVVSPYSPAGRAQVSKDGRVAFATAAYGVQANDVSVGQAQQLVDTAKQARSAHVEVAVTGAVAKRAAPPSLGSSAIGLVAAAVVLLLTFGSLFSMLLPIVAAAVSVGTAMGLLGVLSHVMEMPQVSPEIGALMGLGVGVDYALFIVTRYRQGLMAGREPRQALAESAVTSGRSVLFAGVTVCIAMLGMFTVRLSFLNGLAVAASVAVLLTMVAALTLLPALLRLFGPRVLSRRERRRLASGELLRSAEGRAWVRWARAMTRRPLWPALASLAVVGVLAVPFFSLRMGMAGYGLDAKGMSTRQAYDMIEDGFGAGANGPLVIVGKADGPDGRQAVARAAQRAAKLPDVQQVLPPQFQPARGGGSVGVVTVYPKGAPQDRSTADLVDRLRHDAVPAAVRGTSAELHVGGATATYADFSQAISDKLPLFVGVVVAISFVLLAVVFRSLLIPLTAAVMNLLAAAVAFGVITAVFQWGWLSHLVGVDRGGPIEPFVPVLLFAGLFGLSMDYEVFLVSRIQEEWHRRRDTREAVVHGLAATGRTITAAAAIMVLVFAAFMLGDDRIVKMAGLGLAMAVLLDAVVIRSALVPAAMALLGRANWWFPRWLDRLLPRVNVEGGDGDAPPEEPGPAVPEGAHTGGQSAS